LLGDEIAGQEEEHMTAVGTAEITQTPLPLMQIATAHWAFKTLAAAHELDLFTRLSGTAGTTADELAAAAAIDERPAEILLTACSALGLLEQDDGRYRNSAVSEEFLVRGKRYYFGGFVQMQDRVIYPAYGRVSEAIRRNRPTAYDPERDKSFFQGQDPAILENFWEGMHSLSTLTAGALAEAFDFGPFNKLLDVGGGSAAFDIELCRRYPHLRATVYDLPFVTEIAARRIEDAGLADRIAAVSGDFFVDEALPTGHDVLLLSLILHGENESRDREIVRKCFEALPRGGALLISELLVDDEKAGPPSAALMSMTMLVATDGGRNYTASEYHSWLRETGFHEIEVVPFEGLGANGVVVGRKP
jgi:3-hydroxy-5-methyl-1-naphthoate 3-O-methyltransferase